MENEQKNVIMRLAIIGSTVVAVILVLGTLWTGQNANKDTETAVRTVSLLYLDELAGRREQVVASTLNNYIRNMDAAIGVLDKDDLSSVEHLQAYQARMKQLYDLEKFAFVDTDGLIYTSRGTRTNIDQYHFDYNKLVEPEISIKYLESDNKKVIIAMPVDRLPFEGKHLVVCFMEIDMENMLKALSIQSNNNNNTFCNIYTNEGVALTNFVLGGLSKDNNLLEALEQADFEPGHSLASMREDFATKKQGVVSRYYVLCADSRYRLDVDLFGA